MTDETQLDDTLDMPADEGLPEIDLAAGRCVIVVEEAEE